MKSANEILQNPISTLTTQAGVTTSTPRSTSDNDRQFVNGLFRTLQAIFPAWRQAFADDNALNEAKRQWTLGLVEAGLTNPEAIKAGLMMARKSKNPFIPSVGQFAEWCAEAVRSQINFPSIDSVIAQISRYSHSRKYNSPAIPEIHPVAYWIYQHIDTYALSRADDREARRMVSVVYDEASAKAAQGFEFPSPPILIPEEIPSKTLPASEKKSRMAQMRAEIGI